MATNIYLGLGSNLGNRKENINQAIIFLEEADLCKVVSRSSIYESVPYGPVEQDNFYNSVIKIETNLEPIELLIYVKEIERRLGRNTSYERWGPRQIDIDILFYNNLIYDSVDVKIPHPEVLKRDFVFVPLLEIDKELEHPVYKKKIIELIDINAEKYVIKKIIN